MAWSTPRSWSVGETLTASNMNTYLSSELTFLAGGYGTSFPGSPGDNQRYVLVDSATNPTYQWDFRYNASSVSTYKWEFVGGAPLCVAGLSTTLPAHAGDYFITAKCGDGDGGTATGSNLTVNLTVGGVTKDSATQNAPSSAASGGGNRGKTDFALMAHVTGASSGATVAINGDQDGQISILPYRLS